MPHDDFAGLRPGLVPSESANAEYLVKNFFQFPPEPLGYERIYESKVGGALIGVIYRRSAPRTDGR